MERTNTHELDRSIKCIISTTVQLSGSNGKRSMNTYTENPCNTVVTTKNTKYILLMGGVGKCITIPIHTAAKPRRIQNAYNHGRSGLSPILHFAANHPPIIWHGKSIRTASARSSRPSPFSTSLRLVTASFAWNPILQTRCTRSSDWMSARVA